MDNKQAYSKYYNCLAREGKIKSAICAGIVAFGANFLTALITFILGHNGLWIAITAGVVVGLISAPLFYYRLFKPTTKDIARRVDALGLEERIITMMELENDNSFIAMRQREDAKAKLETVSHTSLKFAPFKAPIVAVIIIALLGSVMTTLSAFSESIMAPDPSDIVDDIVPLEQVLYINVHYLIDGNGLPEEGDEPRDPARCGGYILGESEQLITMDGKATPVEAVADEGYQFVQWDDEITDIIRTDDVIVVELTLTAIFQRVAAGGAGGAGGAGEGEGEGEAGDESQEGNSNSDGAPEGEDSEGDASGSGKYEDHNQIIDGETYYKDVIQAYYEDALARIEAGEKLSPDLLAAVEAYYAALGAK